MFQVVYQGHVRVTFFHTLVAEWLGGDLGIPTQQAMALLKKPRVVLKKDLGEAEAREERDKYWEQGLVVEVEDMPAAALVAEEGPPPNSLPMEFHGKGGEYFRIWIVNLLLTIVTLGIYSAWAKVRRKSYFYGNTRLDGVGFEFLADPKKILKGRLIAVAILGLYQVALHFHPVAGGIAFLGLALFYPWAMAKSLAFNARNSAYRNIRFNFRGRTGQAFAAFLFWPLLGMVTLGLAWPVAYRRQKMFVVDNMSYGTRPFVLSTTNKDFYKVFLRTFLAALGFGLVAIMVGLVGAWVEQALAAPGALNYFSMPATILFYIFVYAVFSARVSNLVFNHSHGGNTRFYSTLPAWGYAWVVISNTIATALTLGLFHPWASVRAWRYRMSHLSLATPSLEGFVAAQAGQVDALGSEATDIMGFDFGL